MSCSEWKEYKLDEVCLEITDGSHSSPKSVDKGYPMASVKDMNYFDISIDTCRQISEEDYNKLTKGNCKPKVNDVLIAKDGSYMKHVNVVKEEKDLVILSSIAILRPNVDIINPNFLKYYLLSPSIKQDLEQGYVSGSAIRRIVLKDFRRFPINLPPLEEQEKIADILSSLDDKIELNNEMNKTLEEMAQSIFKRWFVDFEFPNENGEPYKSSGGEMIESELGMVPKGWEVGSFSDISEILDSKRIPLSKREREKRANIYPYYGAASLMDYVDDYIFEGIHVLMGEDGTVIDKDGFPILQYVGGKFWVNNHAHVLKGKNEFSNEFVYLYLSNTNVTHLVTGAVQPKINQKNLTSLKLPIPDKNMTVKFNSLAKNIFEDIYEIRQENKKLEEIRSILLPVLMNGTINIK